LAGVALVKFGGDQKSTLMIMIIISYFIYVFIIIIF